jgi:hypothetical protein
MNIQTQNVVTGNTVLFTLLLTRTCLLLALVLCPSGREVLLFLFLERIVYSAIKNYEIVVKIA